MEALLNKYLRFDTEIEARLGRSTPNGFVSGVDVNVFDSIKNKMNRSTIWDEKTFNQSRDVIVGKYRNSYDIDGNVTCLFKERLFFKDSSHIRVCVNTERVSTPVTETTRSVQRTKRRWSYVYGMWRYDLTHTVTDGRTAYEVELELFDVAKALHQPMSIIAKSFDCKMKQLVSYSAK